MDWSTLFFVSVGECCSTPLGVIAMCKSFMSAFQYFIMLPLIFLHGLDIYGKFNYKVTWNHGFFILVMYIRSGYLPSAENLENPFLGAFRIKIVILFMVLLSLNITYCITNAVIISFSRSARTKPIKHIQGLLTYFFIIILCMLSMTLIYEISDISETFNILSLCVSTCVQALSSIIVYIIYVYDRMYSRPWEITVEEQMQNVDRVCSICQYSISTAKIIPCGHFFHRMCLQKWMYINELCPVCRQSVF
ncbi:RING finger protein 145-like [Saccostrea cucullata]|uniref:RING finger protein 145-like n=1 Tax=Saccostrea cuccullata TaxID=36930 RepID=UPI002ED4F6A1